MVSFAPRPAVVALLLVCLGAISGCKVALDPTESTTVVRLQNDLGVNLRVAPCTNSGCRSLAGTVRNQLRPGEVLPANVSTDGTATYYRVDKPGGPPRCLRLAVNGTPRESTVPLSSAGDCASSSQGGAGVLGTVVGWGLFLGVGLLGLGTTAVVTRHAYRRWRNPPLPDLRAAALAAGLGLILFAGGWILFLVYWLFGRASRLTRGQAHPA